MTATSPRPWDTTALCEDAGLPLDTQAWYWSYTDWEGLDDVLLQIQACAQLDIYLRRLPIKKMVRVVRQVKGSPSECVLIWYLP